MVKVPNMNMNRFTERLLLSSTATSLKMEGNLTFGVSTLMEDSIYINLPSCELSLFFF